MKRSLFFVGIAILFAACGKDPSVDPSIGIIIAPAELTLHVGDAATISATVTPADLTNKTVLWTSANTAVATVSDGQVKAVGAGTTTITALTDRGGQKATCKVTVVSPVLVKAIDLGSNALYLDPKDGTYTFNPGILPADATDKRLAWNSSNEEVVTVFGGTLTIRGKGVSVVTVTAIDDGHAAASCSVTVVSLPEAVDLGLTVKWASFNIGGERPEDCGDFFAWGELSTKDNYGWKDYSLSNVKTLLDPGDDIATVSLGEGWRMPSRSEFEELMNEDNCEWSVSSSGSRIGVTVTGKKAGFTEKTIFLPAAGYMDGVDLVGKGDVGNYWSSTCSDEPEKAYSVGFPVICGSELPRCLGLSIRPVKE